MKNNELNISVVGTTGTGKSTIAYLLADFLSHTGFQVNLNLLDDTKPEDIEEHFTERLQGLHDKHTSITINEVQYHRVSEG